MRLLSALVAVFFVYGFILPALPLSAQTGSSPDILPESSVMMQVGEALWCLSDRAGLPLHEVTTRNRILNPVIHKAGLLVKLPPTRYWIRTIDYETTLLSEAMRGGVADYTLRSLNRAPVYYGSSIIYPPDVDSQTISENSCFPYPVTSITYSSDGITRGETMVIALETAVPTLCEAHYLGRREPCYGMDDTHLYILVGTSALELPGVYDLHLRFSTQNLTTSLVLPFSVYPGYYGFQYINPPTALNALMDKDVMQAEEDFLQPWREIRTPHRLWTVPLGFPLTMQLPISADYGDRRSYGGMLDGYHSGIDFRAWTGLPVLAPADGIIIFNERLQARGNAILIDHGWGLVTGYWHLSVSKVTAGQYVKRGDVIAEVGNTGLSTGSHLHWETWVNGVSVDGKQWYDPQGFSAVTPTLSQ